MDKTLRSTDLAVSVLLILNRGSLKKSENFRLDGLLVVVAVKNPAERTAASTLKLYFPEG